MFSREFRLTTLGVLGFVLFVCSLSCKNENETVTLFLGDNQSQVLEYAAKRSISTLKRQLSDITTTRTQLTLDTLHAITKLKEQLFNFGRLSIHNNEVTARKAIAALRLQLKDAVSIERGLSRQSISQQLVDARRTVKELKAQLRIIQNISDVGDQRGSSLSSSKFTAVSERHPSITGPSNNSAAFSYEQSNSYTIDSTKPVDGSGFRLSADNGLHAPIHSDKAPAHHDAPGRRGEQQALARRVIDNAGMTARKRISSPARARFAAAPTVRFSTITDERWARRMHPSAVRTVASVHVDRKSSRPSHPSILRAEEAGSHPNPAAVPGSESTEPVPCGSSAAGGVWIFWGPPPAGPAAQPAACAYRPLTPGAPFHTIVVGGSPASAAGDAGAAAADGGEFGQRALLALMLFLLVLACLVCGFSAMGCAWAYREYQRQEGWRPRPDWADRPPQSARFCAGEQSAGPKEGAPGGPPAASGPGRPGPPAGDPALIPGAWPSAAPANEAGLGLGAPPRPPSRSGGPPPPPPAGPIRPRTGAPVGVGR